MTDIDTLVRKIVREELSKLIAANENQLSGKNDYFTTKDVAKYTGMSTQFFEIGRSKGCPQQPPHIKVGTRVLYSRADVDEWLASRRRV